MKQHLVPDDMTLYCGLLSFEELNRLYLELFPSEFVVLGVSSLSVDSCASLNKRFIEDLVPQPSLKRVNHRRIIIFSQKSIAKLVSQDDFVSQPVLGDHRH